jgi:hypothetical protein
VGPQARVVVWGDPAAPAAGVATLDTTSHNAPLPATADPTAMPATVISIFWSIV